MDPNNNKPPENCKLLCTIVSIRWTSTTSNILLYNCTVHKKILYRYS